MQAAVLPVSSPKRDAPLNVGHMVAKVACIIFTVELGIMFAMYGSLFGRDVLFEGLIDATSLTIFASPLIYYWVAHPFAAAADAARLELAQQLAQTKQLLEQNESLRVSLQKSSEATAEIHERVLQRIGADLHDGPAQFLTFAVLKTDRVAQAIERSVDQPAKKDVDELRSVIGATLKEVRGISTGLSLPELAAVSLREAIELSVQRHEQIAGTKIQTSFVGTPRELSAPHKICAYRFVQEALSNSHKHGKAKSTNVSCEFARDITIIVSDDGQGFNPAAIAHSGLGITGMRARVQALNGQFEITSANGMGTRVIARFGASSSPDGAGSP